VSCGFSIVETLFIIPHENKRCKILNKVLNMNWDYVRGKKTQKENKNKQTKRKNQLKIFHFKGHLQSKWYDE
jgi:hypothetical protein